MATRNSLIPIILLAALTFVILVFSQGSAGVAEVQQPIIIGEPQNELRPSSSTRIANSEDSNVLATTVFTPEEDVYDFSGLDICSYPQVSNLTLPRYEPPNYATMTKTRLRAPLVCRDFFTVIPAADSCSVVTGRKIPLLDSLGAQMVAMGTTLTVFVEARCPTAPRIPGVVIEQFDLHALLKEFGFEDALIRAFPLLPRIQYQSDILRILLQLKTRKSYIDTDIFFVSLDRNMFWGEYNAACFWADGPQGQIEITNAAFCHRPETLRAILYSQMSCMRRYDGKYPGNRYTGMASVMMLRGASNQMTGRVILQNHPLNPSLPYLVSSMVYRNLTQLHITTGIQRQVARLGYTKWMAAVVHSYCNHPARKEQWVFQELPN